MADKTRLTFEIDGDSAEAVRAVERLTKALESIVGVSQRVGTQTATAGEKAEKALTEAAGAATKAEGALQETAAAADKAAAELSEVAADAGKASTGLEKTTQAAAKAEKGLKSTGAAAGKAGAELVDAADKGEKAAKTLGERFEQVGRRAERLEQGMRQLGMAAAAGSAPWIASAKLAMDFDAAMRNVDSVAKLSTADFDKLNAQVLRLAKDANITKGPTDLANGLYQIYSSGLEGQAALDALYEAATGATAGLTETSTAATALLAVLNSGVSGVRDAGDAMDVLFKTVDLGVLNFEQLASSIGAVLPTAKQAGVSLQEIGAAVAVMTRSGQSASDATNDLLNLITKIIRPSEEAEGLFQELGISYGVNALRAKGLAGVLAEIAAKTRDNAQAQQELFPDMQASRGLLSLLTDNGAKLTEMLEEMQRATDGVGAKQSALDRQLRSAKSSWEDARKQLELAAIATGKKLLPELISLLDVVAKHPDVAVFAVKVGAVAVAVNQLAQALNTLGAAKAWQWFSGLAGGTGAALGVGLGVGIPTALIGATALGSINNEDRKKATARAEAERKAAVGESLRQALEGSSLFGGGPAAGTPQSLRLGQKSTSGPTLDDLRAFVAHVAKEAGSAGSTQQQIERAALEMKEAGVEFGKLGCARFVTSALKKAGFKGVGSASSTQLYDQLVAGGAQLTTKPVPGDVFFVQNGRGTGRIDHTGIVGSNNQRLHVPGKRSGYRPAADAGLPEGALFLHLPDPGKFGGTTGQTGGDPEAAAKLQRIIEEARIGVMAEGIKKRLALIDLEFRQSREAATEEAKKAKRDPSAALAALEGEHQRRRQDALREDSEKRAQEAEEARRRRFELMRAAINPEDHDALRRLELKQAEAERNSQSRMIRQLASAGTISRGERDTELSLLRQSFPQAIANINQRYAEEGERRDEQRMGERLRRHQEALAAVRFQAEEQARALGLGIEEIEARGVAAEKRLLEDILRYVPADALGAGGRRTLVERLRGLDTSAAGAEMGRLQREFGQLQHGGAGAPDWELRHLPQLEANLQRQLALAQSDQERERILGDLVALKQRELELQGRITDAARSGEQVLRAQLAALRESEAELAKLRETATRNAEDAAAGAIGPEAVQALLRRRLQENAAQIAKASAIPENLDDPDQPESYEAQLAREKGLIALREERLALDKQLKDVGQTLRDQESQNAQARFEIAMDAARTDAERQTILQARIAQLTEELDLLNEIGSAEADLLNLRRQIGQLQKQIDTPEMRLDRGEAQIRAEIEQLRMSRREREHADIRDRAASALGFKGRLDPALFLPENGELRKRFEELAEEWIKAFESKQNNWRRFWKEIGHATGQDFADAMGASLQAGFEALLGAKGRNLGEMLRDSLRSVIARALTNITMRGAEDLFRNVGELFTGSRQKRTGDPTRTEKTAAQSPEFMGNFDVENADLIPTAASGDESAAGKGGNNKSANFGKLAAAAGLAAGGVATLVGALQKGKDGLGSAVPMMIAALVQLVLAFLVAKAEIQAGPAGAIAGVVMGIASLFGGKHADGGRPQVGKLNLVGERGPELFVPDMAGTIIPNHLLNVGLGMPSPRLGLAVAGGSSSSHQRTHNDHRAVTVTNVFNGPVGDLREVRRHERDEYDEAWKSLATG